MPIKILIADDDIEFCKIMKIVLAKHFPQAEIDLAFDGSDALDQFQDKRHDIVLLDIMMPIMNGWEVSRKIRKHEDQNSKTKIIIISGIGTDLNEMVSPLYGADDYMDKPITIEALADKIRQFLEPPKEQTA